MKIRTDTVITQLNGKPVMQDQEQAVNQNTGVVEMIGGTKLTVGDVLSIILSTKKTDKFNILKADALAHRFYNADIADLDESDYRNLYETVEQAHDRFSPGILAQVLKIMIAAKDGQDGKKGTGKK
jgi:hypothetical protein